jgi:hypothetical protein
VLTALFATPATTASGTPTAGGAAPQMVASAPPTTAASGAAQARLCVEVLPLQENVERGQSAEWAVAAWATGGAVPGVTIRLQTTPAGSGTPAFNFGCGTSDGSATCVLGTVDITSTPRQLQVQATVPLTAASVTSVALTVTGSAASLHTDPAATAPVSVLAPASPVGASTSLSVLDEAGVDAPAPTLSQTGSVAGLLPTLGPGSTPATGSSGTPSPEPSSLAAGSASRVADSAAITHSSSTADAQLAGLAALGLACLLAVTRVSIRRPASAGRSGPTVAPAGTVDPPAPAGTVDSPAPAEGPDAAAKGPEHGEGTPTAEMSKSDVELGTDGDA